jgi:hypothetical protein
MADFILAGIAPGIDWRGRRLPTFRRIHHVFLTVCVTNALRASFPPRGETMPTSAEINMTSRPWLQELEQLFREHYPMLYRTAYSLLDNAADAEDVPQTIFLRLLRSGLPPDMQRNPAGYLYRAAVNASITSARVLPESSRP